MGEQGKDDAEASLLAFKAINRSSMAATPREELSRSSKSAPGTPKLRTREPSVNGSGTEDGSEAPAATSAASDARSKSRKPTPASHSAPEEPAQSHPVTTTTSASSRQESPAAPTGYGTRSRNRPGAVRPNYAEDIEMDFEQPNGGEHSSTELSSQSPAEFSSRRSPAPPTKKGAATANGWSAVNPAAGIPGTSTFSANPNVSVPHVRKRKAAQSQNAMNGTLPVHPAPTQATTRRSGTSAVTAPPVRENNMFSFEKCRALVNKAGKLLADDGTLFAKNDHVYLVCEPPGDPYYLGRIMEFRFKETDNPATPVEAIRINWVYRPRDVQRFSNDTRLVYATMHSDICPLTSLRGKCRIMHRSDIPDLDEYRKHPDSFWFNQCFDRFIHRWYEVVPVSQVINVPENVKKALDERWKFVVVEATRVKELTSAVKTCKRCAGYCATNDSVECAVCHLTYHMTCVRPPLLKKPSRGFAWACAPCSRAQERKLEARRTPIIGGEIATDADEDEFLEEEEEEPGTGAGTTAPSPKEVEDRPATEAEIAHAKMWPMRYLGIHCRVEDALQYDDRAIYPRASSRLGVKHQANVHPWPGRPVQLVKPIEIKKKYIKNTTGKKDTKLTKETIAAIEADKAERAKRPKWVQDEPPGYQHRGDDHSNKDPQCTAKLLFKMPPQGEHSERGMDDNPVPPEEIVDAYMLRAKEVAKGLRVPEYSTDFLDRAVHLLQEKRFDTDAAIKELKKIEVVGSWPRTRLEIRKDLREPRHTLRKDEIKRFEEGVAKFGSELRLVRLHVKTVPHADIVRFWYYWKKTDRGKQIWGSYGGRKNTKKKAETEAASKLLDDIADAHDDSAFDNEKVYQKARKMICKFCSARKSRCWRRAPGVTPGQSVPGDGRSREKHDKLLLALCQRCARLWRKYAIKWEDQDEIAKKISQSGGRAWKRRVDEELLKEWQLAQQELAAPDFDDVMQPTPPAAEPPRKKLKGTSANDTGTTTPTAPLEPAQVKKRQAPAPPPPPPKEPTPPPPPINPNPAKMRQFPCAVCECFELPAPEEHPLLTCRGCRLVVHKSCYGVENSRVNGSKGDKFWCDMCWNDGVQAGASIPALWTASSSEPASYDYKCVLCPVEITEVDLVEPPKVSHKKKTDREREKERMEKELCIKLGESYRQSQREKGRPILPREPLKRTANNNWVHVTCAVFTEEVRFSNAKTMERAEGIPSIPKARWEQVCKLCKKTTGACVACQHCGAFFHVGCAHQYGYIFGFDLTPVKSSRRDSVSVLSLGEPRETGMAKAAIWCKEHENVIKTMVHPMHELGVNTTQTALELFVESYKQADLALTGTTRKANLLDEFTRSITAAPVTTTSNRRVSSATASGATRAARNSSVQIDGETKRSTPQKEKSEKVCVHCKVEASPKWWPYRAPAASIRPAQNEEHMPNGIKPEDTGSRGSPMQVDQPVPNGVRSYTPPAARPSETGAVMPADLTAEDETFECTKCHWRRINMPEDFNKSNEEPEPAKVVEITTSPRPPAPTLPGWSNPLPTSLPQPPPQPQPQMPGWPPQYPSAPPIGHTQAPPHHPLHPHLGFPQPPPPPPPPGPGGWIGPPQPLPPRAYPPPTAPPPHSLHSSTLVSGVPNGIPSPRMQLSSPTHPPPPMHFPSRPQTDSAFTTPHTLGGYGHAAHHGSPAPPPPPPPPPPPAVTAPGGVRPSTPRDVSATSPGPPVPASVAPPVRVAHGASASPNVRNLIDG